MPDVFSVSLVIIGLFYALRYFEDGKIINLIFYFLLVSAGILCKIPALSLMSVLVIPLTQRFPLSRKLTVMIMGVISVILASWWYFYWAPYLVETYHFKLFYPKGVFEGLREIIQYPVDTLDKFWFTAFYSFIAFAFFLAGLVLIFIKKERLMIYTFSIVSLVFVIFMLKSGSVFSFHNYYIIPYVPVMALLAGFALSKINVKWQIVVLFLIAVESLANQAHDFRIKETELYKLELEEYVENVIAKDDLVIVNGGANPQTLYFLHRKGWTVENGQLTGKGFIEEKAGYGARFLIIDKNNLKMEFPLIRVFSNEYIDIYSLEGL
jgi:hypothetical protein